MKEVLMVALVTVIWSLRPIGSNVVQTKATATAAAAVAAALAPAEKQITDDNLSSGESVNNVNNGSTPCDRYLRSAEVDVRSPRNHKFVTSNGWAERQRPRPEINVYSRVEELTSPQPPLPAAAETYYHQQQRESFYQQSRLHQQQPPAVRTSKRIIYYATLPDVIRTPAGYPPPVDPFAIGPGPYSADFRQLDSNRNLQSDNFPRNRLMSYENGYNTGGRNSGVGGGGNSGVSGGGGTVGVTSVTSKSAAVYNSRYDEPAEFRGDSFYRPNEFTSKFPSWAEPFYKSWTSSSWDKESPSYSNSKGSSSFSWDREPLNRGSAGDGRLWDREPLTRGGSWENRGSSWDSRDSPWDKDLVEVPLQKKPNDDNHFNNEKYPEVAVIHSGVIDIRGDRRQQNGGSPPSPAAAPPPRFTIIDVDPKPYQQPQFPQQPASMRYDNPMMVQQHMVRYESPQKPMRYEAYTPMQPPTFYEQQQPPMRYEQQQPPSSMRYEQQQQQQQQYQKPPSSSTSSSSTARHGQQQNQNKQPPDGYYETIKNNINTHQIMTSWTEVSTQDDVSPTHTALSLDISSLGNSTSVQSNKIIPYTNTTKTPK